MGAMPHTDTVAPRLIALTGGIASGKSTVATRLAELGAVVIDADQVVRDLQEPGQPGWQGIREEFGPEVFTADGLLDRAALGALVFADAEARGRLNAVMHPLVRAEAERRQQQAGPGAVVVRDVPLLVETGQAGDFETVLVVQAPEAERVRRMVEDRGMDEAQARARIAAQATDAERAAVATAVLDNSGTREELLAQVDRWWQETVEADPARRLAARYGTAQDWAPARWNPVLDLQLRHRSVRSFLPDPVTEEQLRTVVAAAQSGSTSSNLQLVSVVAVADPEVRTAFAEVGRQPYIAQAPTVLVWLLDFARSQELARRPDLPERVRTDLGGLDYLDVVLSAAGDAGIAAQNALLAAESLGLGGVYLGGLRNDARRVAELIDLPEGVLPMFGLALGRPDPAEDAHVKPRLPQSLVLHRERYDATQMQERLDEYEQVLADYYRDHDLDPQWANRLLNRLSERTATATERHRLRELFEESGLRLK